MPRNKKPADAKPDSLRILRDGVFVAADVRKDMGDIANGVDPEVAKALIENGLAKLL